MHIAGFADGAKITINLQTLFNIVVLLRDEASGFFPFCRSLSLSFAPILGLNSFVLGVKKSLDFFRYALFFLSLTCPFFFSHFIFFFFLYSLAVVRPFVRDENALKVI